METYIKIYFLKIIKIKITYQYKINLQQNLKQYNIMRNNKISLAYTSDYIILASITYSEVVASLSWVHHLPAEGSIPEILKGSHENLRGQLQPNCHNKLYLLPLLRFRVPWIGNSRIDTKTLAKQFNPLRNRGSDNASAHQTSVLNQK